MTTFIDVFVKGLFFDILEGFLPDHVSQVTVWEVELEVERFIELDQ